MPSFAALLLHLTVSLSQTAKDAAWLPARAGSLANHPPPSRLCKLWRRSDAVWGPTAETLSPPSVRVGVMTGATEVKLKFETATRVSWVEFGIGHEVVLPQGDEMMVRRRGAVQPVEAPSSDCPAPWRAMLEWSATSGGEHGADSVVILEPVDANDGRITIPQVPFGMGYAWAGVASRTFRQTLLVTLGADGQLDVINHIDAETLLKSVVPSEMPASSPEQALRAQAIAARNFIVTGLGHRHRQSPFDFCAEQHCQVYQGVGGEHPASHDAVESTRGEVLVHGDKVVRALYSARCGGHTENNDVPWQEEPDPALRGRPDTVPSSDGDTSMSLEALINNEGRAFCDPPDGGRAWEVTVAASTLKDLAHSKDHPTGQITNVWGAHRGPGGRLEQLIFEGTLGHHVLERELPIRRALGNLRSAAFVLKSQYDKRDGSLRAVTFRGTGWGHGVGMCQQGAIGRAKASASCGAILAHYYNGAVTSPFWTDRVRGCPSPK